MFITDKKKELMALMELHYVYGIDFPFLHQKPKEKPRKIKRHEWPKLPKKPHVTSFWRQ